MNPREAYLSITQEDLSGVRYRRFSSEAEFTALCNRLPDGAPGCASRRKSDPEWSGTRTYADAERLRINGWQKGAELVRQYDPAHLMNTITERYGINYRFAETGLSVDIGKYLTGEPECWIDEYEDEAKRAGRIIKIGISFDVMSGFEQEHIQKYAVALIGGIDAIESVGYRVELDALCFIKHSIFDGATRSYHIFTNIVPLKQADEPLSVERVAYYMMHASAMRRHTFASWERIIARQDMSDAEFTKAIERWGEATPFGRGTYGEGIQSHQKYILDRFFSNQGYDIGTTLTVTYSKLKNSSIEDAVLDMARMIERVITSNQ